MFLQIKFDCAGSQGETQPSLDGCVPHRIRAGVPGHHHRPRRPLKHDPGLPSREVRGGVVHQVVVGGHEGNDAPWAHRNGCVCSECVVLVDFGRKERFLQIGNFYIEIIEIKF